MSLESRDGWLRRYEREVDILKDKVDRVLFKVPYANDGLCIR